MAGDPGGRCVAAVGLTGEVERLVAQLNGDAVLRELVHGPLANNGGHGPVGGIALARHNVNQDGVLDDLGGNIGRTASAPTNARAGGLACGALIAVQPAVAQQTVRQVAAAAIVARKGNPTGSEAAAERKIGAVQQECAAYQTHGIGDGRISHVCHVANRGYGYANCSIRTRWRIGCCITTIEFSGDYHAYITGCIYLNVPHSTPIIKRKRIGFR